MGKNYCCSAQSDMHHLEMVQNISTSQYQMLAVLCLLLLHHSALCKQILAKKPISGLINSAIKVRYCKSSKGSNVHRDGVLYK